LLGRSDAIAALGTDRIAPSLRSCLKPLLLGNLRAALTTSAAAPAGTGGEPLARLRGHILIAEDNPVNAEVFAGLLGELGCSHTRVTDGRAALAAAATGAHDAILMDVHMPDMDGWTATKRLRQIEQGRRRTPIIAITADASETHRQRCLQAGMDDFLTKPVSIYDLHTTLSRWLNRNPATALTSSAKAILSVRSLTQMQQIERMSRGGFLERVTRLFVESSANQVGAILAAVAREDLKTIQSQCHSLKSAAAHVGADQLSELAAELELAARSGDLARVTDRSGELRGARESAVISLQTAFAQQIA
jgi:CheY-like chemotaxis protein/HPt (histidine-containing phosphotransfer) domain-containing protein